MNQTRFFQTLRTAGGAVATGALLLAAPAGVLAQDAPALPAADDLIERYVNLIGGVEAHTSETSRTVGTISLPAMGLEGSFEIFQAPPDQMTMHMNLPGMGETRTGFDGEVGWTTNPLTGPSLMEGEELQQTREQTLSAAAVRDRSVVPGRETIEQTEYEGEACWEVQLTWVSGRESTDCYSVESGLLIASVTSQATAMGQVEATTIYQDYRDFDGRLLPGRMLQRTMGMEQVMTIESVEYGTVEADVFELPAAIRTLMGEG